MTFLSLLNACRAKVTLTVFFIFFANILSLALPWGVKIIVDEVLVQKNVQRLNWIIMVLLTVLVVRCVVNFARKMTGNMLGETIVCRIREKVYWRVHKLSYANIKKITPAQILTRIVGDVESVRKFVFSSMIDCIHAVLSIACLSMVLFYIHPHLTALSVCILPLFALIYFRLLPHLKEGHKFIRELNASLIARINEVLNGINVVRVFTAEDYEKENFLNQQKQILKLAKRNHAFNIGLWVGIELFTSLGVVVVLWLGGRAVIEHQMSAGELIAFYSYLVMLFSPVIRLVAINGTYQEAKASLDRINNLFDITDEVNTNKNFVHLTSLKGRIEFHDVSYGYSPDAPILNKINFTVEPGQVVGVVGTSGVGKTTLINLLLRFIDPQEGCITIDGFRLDRLNVESYRKHLAVVIQDDYLFSGTIQENISYGSFLAPTEAVIEAARSACAEEFINRLKEGYQTQVGERGTRLSNGQRQRIALARAFLRNPSVLVLDEATSSLDSLTKNTVESFIHSKMKGRTVFMIAHRLSAVVQSDIIIVLDKGRIAEIGGHNYLLKKNGVYSRLYEQQFKNFTQSSHEAFR